MTAALSTPTLRFYVNLATKILIEVAQGRRKTDLISYSELMDEMGGPGRRYIAEVLEEVSCREHQKKHPLLSALVVHKTNRRPGYGFWCIKVLPQSEKNASDSRKMTFWRQECKRVREYWTVRIDIYEKLINVARSQNLISYDDLNKQLNLGLNFNMPPDRDLIGQWLGEISENEVKAGRHMLSAIVGHKEGEGVGDPGKGFYEYAMGLGVYKGEDDLGFWAKEVKWLHDYWSSH